MDKANFRYDSCHTSPQSTSEKYYCPFIGDQHAGNCEDKSHYRYCTYTRKLLRFENFNPVYSLNCNDFQNCITDAQFKDDPVGYSSGRTVALFIGTTGMSCVDPDSDLKIDYKMCPSNNPNINQCKERQESGLYYRCAISVNDGSIIYCRIKAACYSKPAQGTTFAASGCLQDYTFISKGRTYYECTFINNIMTNCDRGSCYKTGAATATCNY